MTKTRVPKPPKSKIAYFKPLFCAVLSLYLFSAGLVSFIANFIIQQSAFVSNNNLPSFCELFFFPFLVIVVSSFLFYITIRDTSRINWWRNLILVILCLSLISMHYLSVLALFAYLIPVFIFKRISSKKSEVKSRLKSLIKPTVVLVFIFMLVSLVSVYERSLEYNNQKFAIDKESRDVELIHDLLNNASVELYNKFEAIIVNGRPMANFSKTIVPDCSNKVVNCQNRVDSVQELDRLLSAANKRLFQIMNKKDLPFPPAQADLNESLPFEKRFFVNNEFNGRIYLGVGKFSQIDEFKAAAALWTWLSENGNVSEDVFQFIPVNFPHKRLVYPLPSMNTIVIGNPCLNPAVSAIVFEGPPKNCLENLSSQALFVKKGKSFILTNPPKGNLYRAVLDWKAQKFQVSNQSCISNARAQDCEYL